MPYAITQCYLPPGRGDILAFTPAEDGIRFSDPGGMRVSVLGKLSTPIVPLFTKQQKLVAALLRVAGVTAGLAESNGSLPPGL